MNCLDNWFLSSKGNKKIVLKWEGPLITLRACPAKTTNPGRGGCRIPVVPWLSQPCSTAQVGTTTDGAHRTWEAKPVRQRSTATTARRGNSSHQETILVWNDFLIVPSAFVRFPGVLEVSRLQKKSKPSEKLVAVPHWWCVYRWPPRFWQPVVSW